MISQMRMMTATSKHSQSGESSHIYQRFSRVRAALVEASAELAENVSLAGTFLIILPSLAGGDAITFCLSTLIITNQIPPGNSSPGINSTNLLIIGPS